jgi:hypothetical protein
MPSLPTSTLFIERSRRSAKALWVRGQSAPFQIEAMQGFPDGDNPDLSACSEAWLDRRRNRFLPAHCAVYPASRFFRRHTVDTPNRLKEDTYFDDVMRTQFRLDPQKHRYVVLNALTGEQFDRAKPINQQKELLICGADASELATLQSEFVAASLFPLSMQLGTLSTLTALRQYATWQQWDGPFLLLELEADSAQLIIGSPQEVHLVRPIPFGYNAIYPVIQEQLGMKDEASVRALVQTNAFDFSEMGSMLLKRLIKEIQASIGFYEVQTGESVSRLAITLLPASMAWIRVALSQGMGLPAFQCRFGEWLAARRVECADQFSAEALDDAWFGITSMLMPQEEGARVGKKE